VVGDREVKNELIFSNQMYEASHINALVDAFLDQKNKKVYQSSYKPKTFEKNYACNLIVVSSQKDLDERKAKSGFKKKHELILSKIGNDHKLHYMKDREIVDQEIDEGQYNELTQLAAIREFRGIATGKDGNTQYFPQALLDLEHNKQESFESKRIKITEKEDEKYKVTYTYDENKQKTIDLRKDECEELISYVDRQYGFEIDESIKEKLEQITAEKKLFGENGYELIQKKVLVNKTFQGKTGLVSVLNPIKNDLKAGDAGKDLELDLEGQINDLISGWSWEVQQYFKEKTSQEKSVTGLMPLCINQNHWVLLVIDIDNEQKCTLKIKDSMAEAQWNDNYLANLKSALKKGLKNIKINPDLTQNISTVTFAAKGQDDPRIQKGLYCGGHVYRMMRDYIEHGDFYKTQKGNKTSDEKLRKEDYELVQQYHSTENSKVSEENIGYFKQLYRFSTKAVVAINEQEPSRFSGRVEEFEKSELKNGNVKNQGVSSNENPKNLINQHIQGEDLREAECKSQERSTSQASTNILSEKKNDSAQTTNSRQAQLMPSFFSNKEVLNILDPLIVSSAKPVSKRDEAETTADSNRTAYFSNEQKTSKPALEKALGAFNRDQDRSELGEQRQSVKIATSSDQGTKEVTATLQNFSNRQIAYSNPSEMNADQFKQAVLLSVPTASSQGEIKLSAKSSNFGVLLCFAKAMGEINKASESQQPLALDFEKMKKSDEWHKAEHDFKEKFSFEDFENVLKTYASGQKVSYVVPSISDDQCSPVYNINNLGDDALDFLADQNDLNESVISSFSR
jgi:phosphotransferase system HPr-like phosphotransfer protein